jgi:hypothetical protein
MHTMAVRATAMVPTERAAAAGLVIFDPKHDSGLALTLYGTRTTYVRLSILHPFSTQEPSNG